MRFINVFVIISLNYFKLKKFNINTKTLEKLEIYIKRKVYILNMMHLPQL